MIARLVFLRFFAYAAIVLPGVLPVGVSAAEDAPLTGDAYQYAAQAYQELGGGHVDAAESAASRALQLRPDSRQLGLLLLDIRMRKGDFSAAQRQADALLQRFPGDAAVLAQRGYLAQRQLQHQAAMEDFYAALIHPQGLDEQQQRNVRLAWASSALATRQYQVVLDALAPYVGEPDSSVQLPLAYAFAGLNDTARAHAAAKLAEAGSRSESERVAARQLLEQTMPAERNDLDSAYAALRDKNDRAAVQLFQRAFLNKPGTAAQYSDAAYAAKRAGDNAVAIAWFKQALDANAQLPAGARPFDEQMEFGYRREVQEMSRTVGVVASATYQSSGFGPQNNINVMQVGVEAYWQPESIGYQNGRLFQVFARGYETLYDKSGGMTGSATAQGSVGARYKPVGDMNLVLTAERLVRIGNLSSSDWLVRAGYSAGEGGDIQPFRRDWLAWQFYTEGAYFVAARRYIQSLEARYGKSWRPGATDSQLVVSPHVVLAGDYDSLALKKTALGLGPGISLRYWFRGDAHQAPPSWLDLTAQYRYEFTQTQRAQGLTLRATLWY